MTQEEKQLLIKDLCARLPYGVKAHGPNEADDTIWTLDYDSNVSVLVHVGWRPYLRPMSSMTDEELKELNDKYGSIAYFFIQEPPHYYGLQAQHSDIDSIEIGEFSEIYDWLNARHIDYRGLIERGLALEAPEGMYKTE